jgi:hypothetical protein
MPCLPARAGLAATHPATACRAGHHGPDRGSARTGGAGRPGSQGHEFLCLTHRASAQGNDAGRFFERGCRMMGAHGRAIHHDRVDVVGIGHGFHDPVPVARIGPAVEAIVDRGGRAVFLRQIGPWDAGAQDVKDAVNHAPVIHPFYAA